MADDNDLSDILSWVGRSWACRRDEQSNISTRELGREKRTWIEEELEYLEESVYLEVWNR